jgi:hypothetical protein
MKNKILITGGIDYLGQNVYPLKKTIEYFEKNYILLIK